MIAVLDGASFYQMKNAPVSNIANKFRSLPT